MALVAALDAVEKLRVYNTLKAAEATGRNQRQEPLWGDAPYVACAKFLWPFPPVSADRGRWAGSSAVHCLPQHTYLRRLKAFRVGHTLP